MILKWNWKNNLIARYTVYHSYVAKYPIGGPSNFFVVLHVVGLNRLMNECGIILYTVILRE